MKLALALPLALAAVLAAGPSFAFPHINTISSETLSTSPLRVRTTFTVELVGYNPGAAYWGIHVNSGSGPAVQFFGCEAPASWICESYPPGSTDNVEFFPAQPTWPWPMLTFALVTDQAAPCVELDFYNGILGKTPQVNNDYVVSGCLVVDAPTPARSASWGSVKAAYR
jgi:hypothetical protein